MALLLISFLVVAVILFLANRIHKRDEWKSNLNPYGGYSPHSASYTPNASSCKTDWQYELDRKIDLRAKEIMKREGVDMVDELMMKQAILDVIHLETIKMSDKIRR